MANMRISGLASGMDTEQMIKDLMKAESVRLDRMKQSQTQIQWQQEAYRELMMKIKDLHTKYFDLLSPSTNLSSSASFSKFSYNITSGTSASTAVSVTANADVSSRNLVINNITQLATKATMSGKASEMRGVAKTDFDFAAFRTGLAGKDFEMSLSIGSTTKTIKLNQTELGVIQAVYNAGNDDAENAFAAALNTKISQEFGDNYDNVASFSDGRFEFDQPGTVVRVYTFGSNVESMSALGFTNGQTNVDNYSKTINEIFGLTDAQIGTININGKNISLSQEDSFAQMMDKINKSGAGVQLSYESLSDKFTLRSTTEGSANSINIASGSGAEVLMSKLFGVTNFADDEFVSEAGKNATLQINGVDVVQSSNVFSHDGISYNIKELSATPINVGITVDTKAIVENIKNFVNEYNNLIDAVSNKFSEKKNYSYKPLTDEEREALSDDDIKKWEEKAKSGVLRSAPELDTFLSKLRNALIMPIEGVGISLSEIGIASSSYLDRGKLTIDETKLNEKLESNFDDIVKLFTQQSDIMYNNGTSAQRYKESGLGARIDDILKDYVRTTRDDNGNKGILVMKAGMVNDASVVQNELTKRLLDYDKRIASIETFLFNRENYYYSMFSSMESAMSKLQSQADSLVNMLGS